MDWRSIPFARILIPYAAGILLAMQVGAVRYQHLAFITGSVLLCLLFAGLRLLKANRQHYLKWPYAIVVNVFLILLAFETTYHHRQTNHEQHYTHYLPEQGEAIPVAGTVSDIPVETARFLKIAFNTEAIYSGHTWKPVTGSTIVYADKSLAGTISPGDRLCIRAKFAAMQPPGNPYEFDYAAFLKDRNIYHVVFAKPQSIQHAGRAEATSLGEIGTSLKYKTVETLRNSGLSKDAFSICSALLVGYDDEIDNDVMNSFSHSGTLHVLSVSGLHTGILYACIMALFGLFDRHNRYRIVKCVVMLSCLLLLAAITGFAPAVCRAVLMLSLVLIGKTFFRDGHPFNTLLLSAFILLLFDPYLVKDLGFLLSYFAVCGIMYLYPKLAGLYTPPHKVTRWLWDSSMLSIAATVFTLPISLYYFHQFPTWFILSNLVIIPLSIAIMLGALLLLAVAKIAFIKTILVWLINKLTAFMVWCAGLTDNAGTGYIDNIHFPWTSVVWLSMCLLFLFLLLEKKRFAYLLYMSLTIVGWLADSAFDVLSSHASGEVLVLKAKQQTAVLIRQGQDIYYTGDSLNASDFNRIVRPYLQHACYRNLFVLPKYQFMRVGNETICLLDREAPATVLQALDPGILIISQPRANKKTKNVFAHAKQVVAAGANRRGFLAALKQQCALQHARYHAVNEEGAFRWETD